MLTTAGPKRATIAVKLGALNSGGAGSAPLGPAPLGCAPLGIATTGAGATGDAAKEWLTAAVPAIEITAAATNPASIERERMSIGNSWSEQRHPLPSSLT